MMKKVKYLILLFLFITIAGVSGCSDTPTNGGTVEPTEGEVTPTPTPTPGEDTPTDGGEINVVDYVEQTKLDMSSDTLKTEVTVKLFIDGDTTHFNIDDASFDGSVLKARYLAVNTPESTGKIEPYGKKASNFTKDTLSKATSIIIESDNNTWNADSTGGRYLVWIWYKTSDDSEYRNLNIELLQNGLAIASNSGQNRYGETCLAAINQAKALKLNCQSGKPDPDHYYGTAVELTLKELRTNIAEYNGMKVAFEGVVYKDNALTAYIEEYDSETGVYFGMQVYYGHGASGDVLEILRVGNRVRIVGVVSYYEAGGVYQVSGLSYRAMRPNDPENVQMISSGHSGAFAEVSAYDFNNKKIEIEMETEDNVITNTFSFAELSIHSSISMKNLEVVSIYTTDNEDSSSNGAMTLTCKVDGETVVVRTTVLIDADGNIVTASAYQGKNINVSGFIDYFNGSYQIKVCSVNDITINE